MCSEKKCFTPAGVKGRPQKQLHQTGGHKNTTRRLVSLTQAPQMGQIQEHPEQGVALWIL